MKKHKADNIICKTLDNYIQKVKNSTRNLQAVLSDDFLKQLPSLKVYVGHVKNPKDLSKVVLSLNQKVPLKELQHLKRVRKREVILCPTYYLNGVSSIQEYLEYYVQELKDVFEFFKEVDVPSIPPKVKKQYNNQIWPCNFHPNKYFESLVSDSFFSQDELKLHISLMHMTFSVAKWYLERDSCTSSDFLLTTNATVIVDPLTNSVVAASFCNNCHPIQHAAMLAIDNVAKTQNGGAWGVMNQTFEGDCTLSGIDPELLQHLKKQFPMTKFGARTYVSKRDTQSSSDGEKEGPYLCTGYYVYMLKEPCIMCAMGLVHARAKRIFYCFDNLQYGALNSRTKLQAVASLNHHFEVFTGFL